MVRLPGELACGPETGFGKSMAISSKPTPRIASILAHLLAFFQRGEPVGMYDE